MPTLLEVQRAMSGAILAHDDDAAVALVIPAGIPAANRLNVYRNTFLATLTTALRLSYPAIQRLVGEEFFEATARHFIESAPPTSAYLNRYGEDFASFLAHFLAAQSLSYLPDVARLEWAVNSALHAPDVSALDPSHLSALPDLPPERLLLTLHPSVTLLQLEFPADAIWRAVLANDDDAMAAIELSDAPGWLVVTRGPEGVDVSRLSDAEGRLLDALRSRRSFAEAIAFSGSEDLAPALATWFARGLFVDYSLTPEKLP